MSEVRAPWLNNYGDVPPTLEYPTGSMWDRVSEIAEKYPQYIAYDFLGKQTTYRKFAEDVHICARAL